MTELACACLAPALHTIGLLRPTLTRQVALSMSAAQNRDVEEGVDDPPYTPTTYDAPPVSVHPTPAFCDVNS